MSSIALNVTVNSRIVRIVVAKRPTSLGSQSTANGNEDRPIIGVSASSSAESSPPTRMNGRRRPSRPSQTLSDQAPAIGETIAPSNVRELPSRPSRTYELVKVANQSVRVKLLNALKTPIPTPHP